MTINAIKRGGRAVAAMAMLFCCSPTVTMLPYRHCEEYASADFSNRLLLLALPGEKNIIIDNPKDVADDYGGLNAAPESRITKFYLPLFRETFKSYISGDSLIYAGVNHPDLFDSLAKRDIGLKIGEDTNSLHFSVPGKAAMQAAGLGSVVAILVERLSFKRNNFYVEYYWDDKTKRQANLEVSAKVLIWDYRKDAPVFYGVLSQKIEFQIAMQRKHWDESARALAKKIVLSAKCL
ncbi:MAG: hypothetical protein JXA18_13585 [Chitinispirillaceae bacterium]|nr:hypothetical protein [Chitinispirillaceae bacterium]